MRDLVFIELVDFYAFRLLSSKLLSGSRFSRAAYEGTWSGFILRMPCGLEQ